MDREFHRAWSEPTTRSEGFSAILGFGLGSRRKSGEEEFQQNALEGHDVPEEDEYVTDEGVEANARLIGMTAALLLVLSTRLNKPLHSTFSIRNAWAFACSRRPYRDVECLCSLSAADLSAEYPDALPVSSPMPRSQHRVAITGP
jgi:hypothetical protein